MAATEDAASCRPARPHGSAFILIPALRIRGRRQSWPPVTIPGLLARQLPPALRVRDFRRLFGGFLASSFAAQMVTVAVGWQVYAINRSALDLGLIGLAEFVPLLLFALPAGHLADRMSRTHLFAAGIAAEAIVALLLLGVTIGGARQLWPFLVL